MDRNPHSRRRKKLRERLVNARRDLGLSQTELAKKLGIRQTLVSDIETGVRQLDVIEFLDYCAALKVSALKLLREAED